MSHIKLRPTTFYALRIPERVLSHGRIPVLVTGVFFSCWSPHQLEQSQHPHSVCGGELSCATTVDNSGVCKCVIWKALYPYILDAWLGLWVSLEHTFTCASTINKAEWRSSVAHLLATWEHERTSAWWSRAQGGGPSVIPTSGIHYSSGAFWPECNGLSQFRARTQANPLCRLSENLIL